ncbi:MULTISPECIES: MarR family winged helix-turn-helix transcriptional regulator [Streptomyces]|uniref:MarR family winged helix-turn-helix transcriptional regulator n=1 Tax=Streptomyces TaxID=1883 RepID=UPI0005F8DFB4|nr:MULTISPECIES: MarR family transcriptional regulator [Streptomyces]KJY20542.1 transcriptional regulator [Streptomyces sp. NRRL S-104]
MERRKGAGGAVLEKLERELMLLSRHQVLARRERDAERLERSAYLLLSRIDTQGPMSIGQLAEAFGLDTSTVNRQTAALLRCGLAERVADPDGGMARKLRITAEGGRRLEGDREVNRSCLARVVADWSPEEVRELEDVLVRLNRSAEALEGRHWPRTEEGDAGTSCRLPAPAQEGPATP